MPHFKLWTEKGKYDVGFWVEARSREEARNIVAFEITLDARNPDVFRCEPDSSHVPPSGMILRGDGKTYPIAKVG